MNNQTLGSLNKKGSNLFYESDINIIIFFLISFFVYFFPFNTFNLSIPIIYIFFASILKFFCLQEQDLKRISNLLFSRSLFGLIFVIPTVSFLGFIFSYDSELENVFNFLSIYILGFSSFIVLLDAKDILSKLLSSYYISGVFSTLIVFSLNINEILFSIVSRSRFTNYSFHPNLLGFILAGYSGSILFQLLKRKNIVFNACLLLINCSVILATQSRGSIFAIAISFYLVTMLYVIKKYRKHGYKKLFIYVVLISFISVILKNYADSEFQEFFGNSLEFINDQLELSSKYRGLDSGFTGRQDLWEEVISKIDLRIFIFGNGYRTTSGIFTAVDNGYIVLLYENGIFSLSLLCILFVSIGITLFKEYFSSEIKVSFSLSLSLVFIVLVFLLNNFVARYLFGVGNPFSAFMIMLLFSSSPIFNKEKQPQ